MNEILLQGALVFVIGTVFLACVCCGMSGRCAIEEPDDPEFLPREGRVIPFRNTRLKSKGSNLSFQARHNPSKGGNA